MMRKTLLALAVAASFPTAFAQSRGPEADESLASGPTRLELYGIFDIGVEHLNVGDGVASATRVSSGISAGSRIGFRGSEVLGSGYRAVFVLETRIEGDTGSSTNNAPLFYCGGTAAAPVCSGVALTTPIPGPAGVAVLGGVNTVNATLARSVTTVNGGNAIFDRQAFAGLVTPFGAFLLGRQYTPGYEVLNRFNSFADSTAGQMGQGFGAMAIRANNALQYRAEAAGVTAALMYGFGGTDANRSERSDLREGDDFIGANLQYRHPSFSVGVGYNCTSTVTFASPSDDKKCTDFSNEKGLETFNVGGTVTLGPVKLFAQGMKRRNSHPVLQPADIQSVVQSTGGSLPAITGILGALYINPWDFDLVRGFVGPTNTQVIHLGAQAQLGSGTLHLAYNMSKDTARSAWATEDAKVDHLAIAYFYNLSRRTQLYGVAAGANNKGQARMALGSAGYAGGFTTSPGEDAYAFQLGMRHAF